MNVECGVHQRTGQWRYSDFQGRTQTCQDIARWGTLKFEGGQTVSKKTILQIKVMVIYIDKTKKNMFVLTFVPSCPFAACAAPSTPLHSDPG